VIASKDGQEDVLGFGDEQLSILCTKDDRLRQNRADTKVRHRRPRLLLLTPQTVSGIAASDRELARKDFGDRTTIAHEADLRPGCGQLQGVIVARKISAWGSDTRLTHRSLC